VVAASPASTLASENGFRAEAREVIKQRSSIEQ